MKTSPNQVDTAQIQPAPLPAELHNQFLAAMQEASEEEEELRRIEDILRLMRPAELPAHLAGQFGVAMYVEAQKHRKGYRRKYMLRAGAVAAALMLCIGSGALLVPGSAVAGDDKDGLVSRNVIEAQSAGKVEWRHGGAPVRHYQVIYEDSFVLDTDGTTTVIRVPNTTEVEVEEECL